MALLKLEPDKNKIKANVRRMREIVETFWLRDPVLNDLEVLEFNRLKTEIENMGLYVRWEVRFSLDDHKNPKVEADIDVLIPQNTTLQ